MRERNEIEADIPEDDYVGVSAGRDAYNMAILQLEVLLDIRDALRGKGEA